MAFEDLECIKIDEIERDLPYRKGAYLRVKGWETTSSTVGCYWMWFKTINGLHYGCSRDDAFRIQRTLDCEEYAMAHPAEFGD